MSLPARGPHLVFVAFDNGEGNIHVLNDTTTLATAVTGSQRQQHVHTSNQRLISTQKPDVHVRPSTCVWRHRVQQDQRRFSTRPPPAELDIHIPAKATKFAFADEVQWLRSLRGRFLGDNVLLLR